MRSTKSNQPHLLFLPVTVPNSFPKVPSFWPISLLCSVGKGPSPTLVRYDFVIPNSKQFLIDPIPVPIEACAETVFDEVTKGYVP